MNNHTVELYVYGRVQGVYYRKTIQLYAQKNGITGFIENLENGSVHIIAQGTHTDIALFINLCQKGSLFSHVKKIQHFPLDTPQKKYREFSIVKKRLFIHDQIQSFSQLIKHIMKKTPIPELITVPQHIVIIPNGNRTWSKKRGLDAWAGYWETYNNLDTVMKEAKRLGISHITLWGFSTENWKRNRDETNQLFKVIERFLHTIEKKLIDEKIQFNHFGRKDRLPEYIVTLMTHLEDVTAQFRTKSINLALDYGGRDEIIRAINILLQSGTPSITEEEFSKVLDTKHIPDPDLIIRTANEKRMSGMMPWQATYAEYYFTDVYFPDFKGDDLKKAVIDFSNRKRTFGGDVDIHKKR